MPTSDIYLEPPKERPVLPPIAMIVVPKTSTKSAMIRWLFALGYTVGEIHHATGIQYQMVRNIALSKPKRAAREDLPPLVIEFKPERDIMDDAMDGALDASLLAGRKERKKVAQQIGATSSRDEGDDDDGDDNS